MTSDSCTSGSISRNACSTQHSSARRSDPAGIGRTHDPSSSRRFQTYIPPIPPFRRSRIFQSLLAARKWCRRGFLTWRRSASSCSASSCSRSCAPWPGGLQARAATTPSSAREIEGLHQRVAELEQVEGRLGELENRIEFSERLLTQHRESAARTGRPGMSEAGEFAMWLAIGAGQIAFWYALSPLIRAFADGSPVAEARRPTGWSSSRRGSLRSRGARRLPVRWSCSRNGLRSSRSGSISRNACSPSRPAPSAGWSSHMSNRLGLDWWDVRSTSFVTVCAGVVFSEGLGASEEVALPMIFGGSAILFAIRRNLGLRKLSSTEGFSAPVKWRRSGLPTSRPASLTWKWCRAGWQSLRSGWISRRGC